MVQRRLKTSKLELLNKDSSKIYSSCLHLKMHRLPFPDTHIKTRIPFSRIHSDVWGPSYFKSLDGYRYFVSFLDECTGYLWLFPLYNKSKVFSKFLHFIAYVENQFRPKFNSYKVMMVVNILVTCFLNFSLQKDFYIKCHVHIPLNKMGSRNERIGMLLKLLSPF